MQEPTYGAPFDAAEYVPSRDDVRLSGQLKRVFEVMQDGAWRTVAAVAKVTGDPENSIKAQLRHLRKEKFGAYQVEKRYIGTGLWEYRVLEPVSV